jgi:hypothetical protein
VVFWINATGLFVARDIYEILPVGNSTLEVISKESFIFSD